MEWAPIIFRPNDVVIEVILRNHPVPLVPYQIEEILVALNKLSSDRQYISAGDSLISGRIPYTSMIVYMEHKIPFDLQDVFEELFLYADTCWFDKSEVMRNRKGKK